MSKIYETFEDMSDSICRDGDTSSDTDRIEKRMEKARQQGWELAKAYREEKLASSDPFRHLKRYCKMASMESLRDMADEFALAHEDAELEIVCDEIELRIRDDITISSRLEKELWNKIDASQKRGGVGEMDEADTGQKAKNRSG